MNDLNAYEFDFLPVGDSQRSGDAITFRIGVYEHGEWQKQFVFVVDGGTAASGELAVKHIKEVYGTDTVDRVFLTHPDGDHASGLRTIVRELNIGQIWMHRPWNHYPELQASIVDARVTQRSLEDRLRRAYQYAHEIEVIAEEKGIDIVRPIQGGFIPYQQENDAVVRVLGPSKDLYLGLIEDSKKNSFLLGTGGGQPSARTTQKQTVFEDRTFLSEHLSENGEAISAENDMSLILLVTVAGAKVLLTGDAGHRGLTNAIQYAVGQGISLQDLDIFQVPHHGSRRNLSKSVLQHIKATYGFVSCAQQCPKNPNPVVLNSLHRRGIEPYATNGNTLNWHSSNVPQRPNYSSANALPFSDYVEVPLAAYEAAAG